MESATNIFAQLLLGRTTDNNSQLLAMQVKQGANFLAPTCFFEPFIFETLEVTDTFDCISFKFQYVRFYDNNV